MNRDGYSSLQLRVNVQFGQSFKEAGVDSFHFNVQFCLMIGRRVNACASPDWPKPLKQWGASMAHARPTHTYRPQKCTHGRMLSQRVNLLKRAKMMIP
jgi:hypothetical protein